MRRLSLWMRAHPVVGDSLIALLLFLTDACSFVVAHAFGTSASLSSWYVSFPVLLATVLPLVARRTHPLTAAYVMLVTGALHAWLELGISSVATSMISVYSVVVYVGRWHGAAYFALLAVESVVQVFVQYPDERVAATAVVVLLFAMSWLLGEFVGARRAYQAEVEARLHLLETERDQATRIAVADERSRIARELHDVVAHAVSVIVVHADGASYAVRRNPDVAERAVHTISETGRAALTELRRLLAVLRGDANGKAGTTTDEPRVPQPTASDLAELTDRMRTAGLPVDVELGDLGELPAGVSLGVYRIVQESLTNALKHAGTAATAHVAVRRETDRVTVEVTDDGAGKLRQLLPADGGRRMPGGNGLIGMRERVNVYGGTLDAGPNPGGGWTVRARFPVRLDA